MIYDKGISLFKHSRIFLRISYSRFLYLNMRKKECVRKRSLQLIIKLWIWLCKKEDFVENIRVLATGSSFVFSLIFVDFVNFSLFCGVLFLWILIQLQNKKHCYRHFVKNLVAVMEEETLDFETKMSFWNAVVLLICALLFADNIPVSLTNVLLLEWF